MVKDPVTEMAQALGVPRSRVKSLFSFLLYGNPKPVSEMNNVPRPVCRAGKRALRNS